MTTSPHLPIGRVRAGGRWRRSLGPALVAVALVMASCGSDDDPAADDSTTTSTTVDDSSSTTGDDSTTTGSDSDTTDDASSTTGGSDTTLPGEPFDMFIEEGDVLAVMGVAHDDVLNIRIIPGADTEIIATAEPTADDLLATGEERILTSTIWYELTVGGDTGWVNSSFVAFEGDTDDATAEFLARVSTTLPEVETMQEMGQLVAEAFASEDPLSTIVQSVAPSVGDLGEVTVDVVGLGDDATVGYRLHVFATPSESGEGFVLKSIERTAFCGRGVDAGVCI